MQKPARFFYAEESKKYCEADVKHIIFLLPYKKSQ